MGIFTIDPNLMDPNLVYFLLMFGLWIGVTAIYIPGTGVMEVVALVTLIGAALLLMAMPTNWLAVLLLVIGVLGFITIPFIERRESILAIGGLALQGIGGLLLFQDRPVSWLLIVPMLGVQLAYYRLILVPILRQASEHTYADRESLLVGAVGKVVKPLDPIGTVNVNSELWTASSDRKLKAGDEVIVLERRGLQLIVEGVKHKRESEEQIREGN